MTTDVKASEATTVVQPSPLRDEVAVA